jgi:glycosyltransferase involved in cell wall biosynthesis
LNILIVYQYFGTHNSAWSTRCYEFAKRWVKAGHKVTVLTSPYDKSDIIKSTNIDGINVICSRFKQSNQDPFYLRIIKFLAFTILSTWYALFSKYDTLICSSGPITVGVSGIVAKLFRRKRVIFEVRDLWPRGAIELGYIKFKPLIKLLYWFEKSCYKHSDLIIALSPDMQADIIKRFPNLQVECIPNASDTIFSEPVNNHNFRTFKQPYFVYTGSLGVMDDCIQIIEGIKCYNAQYTSPVDFYFAGKGVQINEMQALVTQYQLKNVHFLGSLPKREIVPLIQNAFACIVCFKAINVLQSSSPNKLFDAFAAGKPVLQNTSGWIKSLNLEYPFGYTWQAGQPESFAEGVFNMLNSPQYLQWSINAKQLAENDFSRDILSNKYLTLLNA